MVPQPWLVIILCHSHFLWHNNYNYGFLQALALRRLSRDSRGAHGYISSTASGLPYILGLYPQETKCHPASDAVLPSHPRCPHFPATGEVVQQWHCHHSQTYSSKMNVFLPSNIRRPLSLHRPDRAVSSQTNAAVALAWTITANGTSLSVAPALGGEDWATETISSSGSHMVVTS